MFIWHYSTHPIIVIMMNAYHIHTAVDIQHPTPPLMKEQTWKQNNKTHTNRHPIRVQNSWTKMGATHIRFDWGFTLVRTKEWLKNSGGIQYSILHPVNTDMRLDRPHWQCYCFSSEGYSLIKVWENDTLHISWMIDLCSYHKCKVTWEALGTPWFYSEHHNESFSAIDIEVWLQGCSKIPKQLCGSLR